MRSTDPERQFGKSNPLSAGHNHDPVEPSFIPLGVCRAAFRGVNQWGGRKTYWQTDKPNLRTVLVDVVQGSQSRDACIDQRKPS